MTWTRFMDMHSGGGAKVPPYEFIYIEAPEDEAKVVFYNRFGHNPERVSCTCCGNDYSISDGITLARVTGHERGCKALKTPRGEDGRFSPPDEAWWHEHYYVEPDEEAEAIERGWELRDGFRLNRAYVTLDEYIARPDVLVIPASDIKDSERHGEVPTEGYVWVGD